MDTESARWFLEQDLDDYNIINEYIQQSFSSESYSYPSSYAKQYPGTTAIETKSERPTKLHKTNSWGSTVTADLQSPKLSSSTSQLLSFASPASPPSISQPYYANQLALTVKPSDEVPSPTGNMHFQPWIHSKPNQASNKRTHSMTRTPSHAQDHILAERKRREKISQRFIALSAIVPGLKKIDKASVLGEAIKYMKQLQERLEVLEQQTKKRSVESVVHVKKSHVSADYEDDENSSSSDDNSLFPEIEARVSEKDILIRIHCDKQQGLVPKVLGEVESMHLSIINTNVLAFGNSTLDITIIAQMDDEFSMEVKDLVKNLRLVFDKFI